MKYKVVYEFEVDLSKVDPGTYIEAVDTVRNDVDENVLAVYRSYDEAVADVLVTEYLFEGHHGCAVTQTIRYEEES